MCSVFYCIIKQLLLISENKKKSCVCKTLGWLMGLEPTTFRTTI